MAGFWILMAAFAAEVSWVVVQMLRGLWQSIKAASPYPARKDEG